MVILPAMSDTIWLWAASSKAPEKVSLGQHVHQQELTAACWSADDAQLAVGASKGAVLIFDTGLKKIKHSLQGVHERVRATLALQRPFVHNGTLLDVPVALHQVSACRTLQLRPLRTCAIQGAYMQAVTCAQTHGSMFATAGEDRKVAFTDFDGTALASIAVLGIPRALHFSPSAASSNTTQMSVLDENGVSVVDVQSALAGTAAGAAPRLDAKGTSGSACHHFWYAATCTQVPRLLVQWHRHPWPDIRLLVILSMQSACT
jgi:hypothetical protein